MTKRARLDAELVRRGLAASRSEAQRAINFGRVTVGGAPADRPATLVAVDEPIVLAGAPDRFVSRGGEKLDRALARLDVGVEGRRWLDAGASSGGFTDRLLQGGASAVLAVDVGYGQLDWRLRNDPRVTVLERTNVRNLTPGSLPWAPEGVAADLSFISLRLVLSALVGTAEPEADFIVLVKPQFEVGRSGVGKGGVVRSAEGWKAAIEGVTESAARLGLALVAAVPSEVPGPAGNREFFVHLRRGATADPGAVDRAVAEVSQ
jgi:23S rRNA (cytidine1920-2'-O)/16S rRNA (cytidine1409-2'-O)-methyltransferase